MSKSSATGAVDVVRCFFRSLTILEGVEDEIRIMNVTFQRCVDPSKSISRLYDASRSPDVPVNELGPLAALCTRPRRPGNIGPDHVELSEVASEKGRETTLFVGSDVPTINGLTITYFVRPLEWRRRRRISLSG